MIDTNALLKAATIACEAAISNGAEFADVSASYGRELSVELESSAIKSSNANLGGGISVRAIYKGGTGWFSSDCLDEKSAAKAGSDAAKLAKLSEPDPDFISLPEPVSSYPEIAGLFDKRISEVDIKQLIEISLNNINEAEKECSSANISGGFSANFNAGALVNSLGVSIAKEGSYIGGHIMAIVKQGADVGSFYDFDAARNLDDFEPVGIGSSAVINALKYLGAKKIKSGRMPVIFGPLACQSILGAIISNCDAESVLRGRSFMIGKVGQKIASDLLTITDDPLIPGGLSSRAYDSEGFPCKPLTILENGILNTYLYGSYTAGKAKAKNTGHGTRGGGASPSNIVPTLGNISSSEIIKSTKEGLYINMGGLRPDATTGDVSSSVDFGFKIENGELAYPVMSTMIGGNFIEMLKNIDAISSDCRTEPGMIMPTIRMQDVLVAGGE